MDCGVSIGNLLEPTLCRHKVRVLDVRSDFLWFTCNCGKLSPWIRARSSCFLGNHLKSVMHVRNIPEMEGCYFHSLKGSVVHTKPLTDLLKKEKKSKNFIIFFDVSQQGLKYVSLQVIHVGADVV